MNKLNYRLDELPKVVEDLINAADQSKIFCFVGEVGAGKTTLINALCNYLKTDQTPSSPTFSIINEYTFDKSNLIYHMDLYRINKVEELAEIGFDSYLYSGDYCFIEWPELILPYLEEPFYLVSIQTPSPENRQLEISLIHPETC